MNQKIQIKIALRASKITKIPLDIKGLNLWGSK